MAHFMIRMCLSTRFSMSAQKIQKRLRNVTYIDKHQLYCITTPLCLYGCSTEMASSNVLRLCQTFPAGTLRSHGWKFTGSNNRKNLHRQNDPETSHAAHFLNLVDLVKDDETKRQSAGEFCVKYPKRSLSSRIYFSLKEKLNPHFWTISGP